MFKCFLAVGLIALSVTAQDNAGPPEMPPPGPDNSPPRGFIQNGDRSGRQQGGEMDGGLDRLMETTMEREMPCPQTTGREWICKVNFYDPEKEEIVKSNDMQPCDERDLCYLGPIMSFPANKPWIKKFMCGPKPCEWRNDMDGKSGSETCEKGICTLGPYPININGTYPVNATFCNVSKDEMQDMEDLMTPKFAKPVCKIFNSVAGETILKTCENNEMCTRGPFYKYIDGIQHLAYICTKIPGVDMKRYTSEIDEMFDKIYGSMMDISDELVLHGYLFHKGPHKEISNFSKKMMELKNHLKFAEAQMKMNGQDKMELPKYVKDMLDQLNIACLMVHNEVVKALWGNAGENVMMELRKNMNELNHKVTGKPSFEQLVKYVHQNVQWLIAHIRSGDMESSMARAAYRSTKEIMSHVYEATRDMEGNKTGFLGAMKEMNMNMQTLWYLMTGSPVMSGDTTQSVVDKLTRNINMVRQELPRISPENSLEKIWEGFMKMQEFITDKKMMSAEAMDFYREFTMDIIQPVYKMAQNLPNSDALGPMLKNFMKDRHLLYNHMTGGMTPVGSSAAIVVQRIQKTVKRIKPIIKEGVKMREEIEDRSPGRQGGEDDGMMGQSRDSMADVDRRLQGQQKGDSGDRPDGDMEKGLDKGYESMKGMGNMGGDMKGGSVMMGGMGGDTMGDKGDGMIGDNGDKKEECKEPLFWTQIGTDKDKWTETEHTFLRPPKEMDEDEPRGQW